MPNEEFIKFFASLGVGGVIAGLLFFFYRKDVHHFTDLWRGQTELLISVVKENTAALAITTELLRTIRIQLEKK